MADKRANKLEAVARNARLKEWRAMIGATTEGGNAKTPTRLAYRWLKGLTGWARSPVSDNLLKPPSADFFFITLLEATGKLREANGA